MLNIKNLKMPFEEKVNRSVLSELASKICDVARAKSCTISTAESCTGGLIASCLTSMPNASQYFLCGFIVYSNYAKINVLSVDENLIDSYGAVSQEVARDMAVKCSMKTNSDIAISTTGILGPGGGSSTKPVGLVYCAISFKSNIRIFKFNFAGNRNTIRNLVCKTVLNNALSTLTAL
ncbi:MAG: CinA family protein [Rickettsiaceae bacterium]